MRATVAELVSKCDGVRHSVNWHYNANDSKPKKGDSNYTLMPPQAEDEMRPSLVFWCFS